VRDMAPERVNAPVLSASAVAAEEIREDVREDVVREEPRVGVLRARGPVSGPMRRPH
jgi:hypothetical protein